MSLPNAEGLYQELLKKLREHYVKEPFRLAGLASGGAWIAERLAKDLGQPDFGMLNVSFHRDDYQNNGFKAFKSAEGRATKIPFDVNGAIIVLVDDVLDTGRTVRAALNELFDYGRPAKVDLAVLVDRHRRQLPVEATFKGASVEIQINQILVLKQNQDGTFSFSTETKEPN